MKVVLFNKEQHYEMIQEWWKAQAWPVIPVSSLSTVGFVVESEGKCLLAGWVYETNSDIALLEFMVANPEVKGDERNKAFDMLFKVSEEYCHFKKYKHIFSSVNNPSLIKRMEEKNFKVTDSGMTNLLRSL